ncbi:MAG: hypothetical protein H6Q68_1927 [Firmicutes bacterium]|nr:hypothetical protein [Bacillota bacterium]
MSGTGEAQRTQRGRDVDVTPLCLHCLKDTSAFLSTGGAFLFILDVIA